MNQTGRLLDYVHRQILKTQRFEGRTCLLLQVWVMGTLTLLGQMEKASLIPLINPLILIHLTKITDYIEERKLRYRLRKVIKETTE